eukprot:scaffold27372_cov137-Isochrysis_galbana.AAC.2
MPRHVDSSARASASPPTRRTPHRLGRQAIFPFYSAWAWDGGGGGGTIGGGGLPPPPYAHSKPYALRPPAPSGGCSFVWHTCAPRPRLLYGAGWEA